MARYEYDLLNGNGTRQKVSVGLADESGAFLLLLDANYTKHYKYADEQECINAILQENFALMDEIEELSKELLNLRRTYRSARTTINRLKATLRHAHIHYEEEENDYETETSGA